MRRTCYISVSNAALCQRCPALLAYTVHRGEKDAWKVGINGSGYYYGTLFHRNIAQVFFEAASNPASPFHGKIARSVSGGNSAVESVIRGNIFIPFLEAHSEECTSGQIMAMSRGITVLSRAMSEFFAAIPSLMRSPEENMRTVFIPPEQKLKACYDCPEGRLIVAGKYDALLFNPDRGEARLFEFKGYTKSDVTVPLSQSLIYSWLVWKKTGVVPSVGIIYLDDEGREPVIFSAENVREMTASGLPGLFRAAYGVISLKNLPEIMRDENLCAKCPFSARCADDWRSLL
ncbi:MAG: PD-(D/E)XK nuclease family protein [Synergistaceae bacterium]|nr:PD-(D/E)XK nuclease family protein [Synergistaceae bacterium]